MLGKLVLFALAASSAAAQTIGGIDTRWLVGFPTTDAPAGTTTIFDNSTALYDETGLQLERRALVEKASLTCPTGFSLNADKSACVCRPGKVLSPDGNLCVARCVTGWYDFGNGSCATCPEPFFACTDAVTPTRCSAGTFYLPTSCVSDCPAGKWGDDAPGKNICRHCADEDAQTCTDGGPDSATSCKSKYLFRGKCIDAVDIPDGYYADPDTKTGEKCDANVKTCICSGKGCATSCGKTNNGDQYLLRPDGTCSMECPGGTYGNKIEGVCVPCDSSALTCTPEGATSCAKDAAGNQLYLTPTKKCVLPWTCPTGYYPDGSTNTCKPCRDGITSCVGSGPSDAISCGKRTDDVPLFFVPGDASSKGPQRLHFEDAVTGTCVVECPAAHWANLEDNTCTPCDAGELSCTKNGDGSAVTCKAGFVLSEGKDCISAEECAASGPFFADILTGVCSSCDPGELACTGNGVGLATECGTDVDGKQLYLYNGDCVSFESCPAATYADTKKKQCLACDVGATSCKGPDQATACGFAGGQRLYLDANGKCVEKSSCKVGTWANPATQICESCAQLDPDASSCTSPTAFTCATKYFYKAACVDRCPSRFYANSNTHVCSPCADPNAATCDAGGALSCESGYLSNRQCLPTCPSGTYADNRMCKSCSTLFGAGTATCTAKKALSCARGSSLKDEECVSDAKCWGLKGFFPDHGLCIPCALKFAYAATCTHDRALSCMGGRWLDKNGKCAPDCVWKRIS